MVEALPTMTVLWCKVFCATLWLSSAGAGVISRGVYQRSEVQVEADGTQRFIQDAKGHVDGHVKGHVKSADGSCVRMLESLWVDEEGNSVLDEISFALHRNGETEPCGVVPSSVPMFQYAISTMEDLDCDDMNKFQVESLLTTALTAKLASNQCGSIDNETAPEGLLGFCDMGPERTPIQLDHKQLVPVSSGGLPCRFFTREGVRISSLEQLANLSRKTMAGRAQIPLPAADSLHLYAVPAGRVFMFAPSYVGERFDLEAKGPSGNNIHLEVLSLNPRIFEIYNFFSREESDSLIEKALSDSSPTHGLHRSTTGTGSVTVFNKRTSENAWDTNGATSVRVKKRCFEVIGLDEYRDSHADGLQVLRYNETKAYTPHQDYLTNEPSEDYDYDSSGRGGNRFATILLYMSEPQGGETVFSKTWPPNLDEQDRVTYREAVQELRESGLGDKLKRGSWEESMAAKCRSRLSVRPNATRAVLFYSQHPNGEEDLMSEHGGCPVLGGTKWAANLWVWNLPRPELQGAPMKKGEYDILPADLASMPPKQLSAVFRNSRKDPAFRKAELFYGEDTSFGNLGFDDPPVSVNTYEGHKWNVKVNGETLKSFVIRKAEQQEFFV